MRRGLLVVVLLTAAVTAFARQESGQSSPRFTPIPPPGAVPLSKPNPSQKQQTTPPKPLPCSQRLKAQVNSNAELSNRVEALERENAALHGLANELTARQLEAASKTEGMLKEREQLIEKQRKLLDQYSAVSGALAGEMMSSEVNGNWTIRTATGQGVCYVQAYQSSRTIQLSNCQ